MLRLWPNNKALLTVTSTTTTTITTTRNYYYYYYYYYYVALSPVIINNNKNFQKMIMQLCIENFATPRGNLSSKPGVPRLGPARLRGAAFS